MFTLSLLTLFPEVLSPFLNHSILKQAQTKAKVKFNLLNFREFSTDKHQSVDDHPYGGGAGMLLMVEPLVKAIEKTEAQFGVAHKLLLSPQGKVWDQSQAQALMQKNLEHVMLICGHYEGFDERLLNYIDEEVSVGNYVLSGGEAAAMVVVDSLVRLIPGVLKKDEATREETFMTIDKQELYQATGDLSVLKAKNQEISLLEYPQYTRPENFEDHKVPSVLLSGNHQKIRKWRLSRAWQKTKSHRGGV